MQKQCVEFISKISQSNVQNHLWQKKVKGPNTDPCGTPVVRVEGEEDESFQMTLFYF